MEELFKPKHNTKNKYESKNRENSCFGGRSCRHYWVRHVGMFVGERVKLDEPLFGAFRADDVFGVRYEAATHERRFAGGADETIVVPVPVFKRDETGTANT